MKKPEACYYRHMILLGFLVILSGALLNVTVLATNNGRMPVYTNDFEYSSQKHFTILNLSEINHPYLIDRIDLFNNIWSMGDLIMVFGISLMISYYCLWCYHYFSWKLNKRGNSLKRT